MTMIAPHSHRDLASYNYLVWLTPDRWAWEYLRRNPAFLEDASVRSADDLSEKRAPCPDVRLIRARTAQTLAERWGLVFMPDPAQDGFEANAVWNKFVFPDQVHIHCDPREPHERCEIWDRTMPHCDITHITDRVGREYLMIRRNQFIVQVRCTGLSLLALEPVRMSLKISEFDGYERRTRFHKAAIELYGEPEAVSEPRWTKTTQVLRDGLIALDCLSMGMSRREIAIVLFGMERVTADWHGPSLKHVVRYLVKKAEAVRDGGYVTELLGGRIPDWEPVCGHAKDNDGAFSSAQATRPH